jgi:hypothetical protein
MIKLSHVTVIVKDERDNSSLSGVLLSLSGENYRNNNLTNHEGSFRFISKSILRPSFFRKMVISDLLKVWWLISFRFVSWAILLETTLERIRFWTFCKSKTTLNRRMNILTRRMTLVFFLMMLCLQIQSKGSWSQRRSRNASNIQGKKGGFQLFWYG